MQSTFCFIIINKVSAATNVGVIGWLTKIIINELYDFYATLCEFQNLTNSHKSDAAKHCNCTISEVEHILAKYSWAKQAQKKIEKLKEEGKPLPKSFSEVCFNFYLVR